MYNTTLADRSPPPLCLSHYCLCWFKFFMETWQIIFKTKQRNNEWVNKFIKNVKYASVPTLRWLFNETPNEETVADWSRLKRSSEIREEESPSMDLLTSLFTSFRVHYLERCLLARLKGLFESHLPLISSGGVLIQMGHPFPSRPFTN